MKEDTNEHNKTLDDMTLKNRENKDKPEQPSEKQKRYKEKDQEIKKDKKYNERLQNLLPKCYRIKVENCLAYDSEPICLIKPILQKWNTFRNQSIKFL